MNAGATEGLDIKPENFVWIFGVGRSGSTWLASMMGELTGGRFWNEPLVGKLFGDLYYSGSGTLQADRDNFVFARKYRDAWLRSIRAFVLDAAEARFPGMPEEDYLAIKEPNGSVGAPLLMEALPESGIILLVRDPRDVVASTKAAREEGGWLDERHKRDPRPIHSLTRRNPEAAVKRQAKKYMQSMGNAKEAYDIHKGRKVMVRYEELRADTLGTMKHLYSTLEIPVDENELAQAVEKHAWENIPDEKKGEGKFNRKARPGSWHEDLTPEQVEIVEEITAPLLRELYAN